MLLQNVMVQHLDVLFFTLSFGYQISGVTGDSLSPQNL